MSNSVSKISDEIAVGEDLGFQRRWWRFERMVWIFFVILIALDLAGAFGRGPLAEAEAHSVDGTLDVNYERIERTGTPSLVTVKLESAALHDGHAELFLSDSAVSNLGLRRVIPAPERTSIGDGGLTYLFATGQAPAIVRFELQPVGSGLFHFEIGARGMTPMHLAVAVVP